MRQWKVECFRSNSLALVWVVYAIVSMMIMIKLEIGNIQTTSKKQTNIDLLMERRFVRMMVGRVMVGRDDDEEETGRCAQ